MSASVDLAHIGRRFQIPGTFVEAHPYGNGHINRTYLATYRADAGNVRYIHQHINERVFPNVPHLMHNIGLVSRHIREKLAAEGVSDLDRHALTLIHRNVPTQDDEDAFCDERGHWWRTYAFVEGATAHEFVDTPMRARTVARAFGGFLRAVSDLDPSTLYETLPNFHDTYSRFESLTRAISEDPCRRALGATAEITYCLQHVELAHQLELLREAGSSRVCVTHNDTKINNVLIDDVTGEAVCVIDLDTVMPGLALYDFGDIVRTASTPAAEDEADLSKVHVDTQMFGAVARGYVEMTRDVLTADELDNLVTAGKVITFEQAIRFLADYLQGDVYFRIQAPDHNLRRARAQLALVQSLEEREAELREIVKRIVV